MYRAKQYRLRPLTECLEDLATVAAVAGDQVEKVFVADGDALGMPMSHWLPILRSANQAFPRLRRVSCYAMASNVLEKSEEELQQLHDNGLQMLYIGPESGDDVTLKRIAKGGSFEDHALAAQKAKSAGLKLSVIALLGAGGQARSVEHAVQTARLVSAMDPDFFSALTLTIVEGTPLARMAQRERFQLPNKADLLRELRIIVDESRPTNAVFRTNHASNYLPIGGQLPKDRVSICSLIDEAIAGHVRLRPEWSRGL